MAKPKTDPMAAHVIFDVETAARLELYRDRQPVRPSVAALIRVAVREFLDRAEKGESK